jgi:hypothetical protein
MVILAENRIVEESIIAKGPRHAMSAYPSESMGYRFPSFFHNPTHPLARLGGTNPEMRVFHSQKSGLFLKVPFSGWRWTFVVMARAAMARVQMMMDRVRMVYPETESCCHPAENVIYGK